jgi:DNA polymerase
MLEEIGIHLWLPPVDLAGVAADVAVQADAPQSPMARDSDAAPVQAGAAVDRAVALAPIARHLDAVPVRVTPHTLKARTSQDLPSAPSPAPSMQQDRRVVAAESLVGVAAMDWPELQDSVANCRACGLCEGRRNTVFGVGHRQARWMLIGEAPGEQEDREGEPFVGKAGQLLDNMLRAAGLTRSDASADRQVYIANVLKCRPPQNRNPLPEEVARCEPYLRRQVALVKPEVILAMGRFAVQSLLGSQEPIGRLRGRVHDYLGVPVVVTYHPAYLLRNPLDKSRSWEDLCLAHEVLRQRAAP